MGYHLAAVYVRSSFYLAFCYQLGIALHRVSHLRTQRPRHPLPAHPVVHGAPKEYGAGAVWCGRLLWVSAGLGMVCSLIRSEFEWIPRSLSVVGYLGVFLLDRHSPLLLNAYFQYSLLGFALTPQEDSLKVAQLVCGATEFWSGLWKVHRLFWKHYNKELLLRRTYLMPRAIKEHLQGPSGGYACSALGIAGAVQQMLSGIAILLPQQVGIRWIGCVTCASVHSFIVALRLVPSFLYIWNVQVCTSYLCAALWHNDGVLGSIAQAPLAWLLPLVGVVPALAGAGLTHYHRNMGFFTNCRPMKFIIWSGSSADEKASWVSDHTSVEHCAPQLEKCLSLVEFELETYGVSSRCVELRSISKDPAFNLLYVHGLLTDISDANAIQFVTQHARLRHGMLVSVGAASIFQSTRNVVVYALASAKVLATFSVPDILFGEHAFGYSRSSSDVLRSANTWVRKFTPM